VRRRKLHPAFGMLQRSKPALLIEPMSVASGKHPPPQALKLRMSGDRLHQHLSDTAALILLDHKYIAEISERRSIADDPRKCNLPLAVINTETDRMLYGSFGLLDRTLTGPVGFFNKKAMD